MSLRRPHSQRPSTRLRIPKPGRSSGWYDHIMLLHNSPARRLKRRACFLDTHGVEASSKLLLFLALCLYRASCLTQRMSGTRWAPTASSIPLTSVPYAPTSRCPRGTLVLLPMGGCPAGNLTPPPPLLCCNGLHNTTLSATKPRKPYNLPNSIRGRDKRTQSPSSTLGRCHAAAAGRRRA